MLREKNHVTIHNQLFHIYQSQASQQFHTQKIDLKFPLAHSIAKKPAIVRGCNLYSSILEI